MLKEEKTGFQSHPGKTKLSEHPQAAGRPCRVLGAPRVRERPDLTEPESSLVYLWDSLVLSGFAPTRMARRKSNPLWRTVEASRGSTIFSNRKSGTYFLKITIIK